MFSGSVRLLKSTDFDEVCRVYYSQDNILGVKKSEQFNNKIINWMKDSIGGDRVIFFGSFDTDDKLISYSYLIKSEYYPSAVAGGVHIDKKYSSKPYNYDLNGRAALIEKTTEYVHDNNITETYFATGISHFPVRMKLFKKMINSGKYFQKVGFKDKWYIVVEEIIDKNKPARNKAFNVLVQYMDALIEDVVIWKLILRPEFRPEFQNEMIKRAYKDIYEML